MRFYRGKVAVQSEYHLTDNAVFAVVFLSCRVRDTLGIDFVIPFRPLKTSGPFPSARLKVGCWLFKRLRSCKTAALPVTLRCSLHLPPRMQELGGVWPFAPSTLLRLHRTRDGEPFFVNLRVLLRPSSAAGQSNYRRFTELLFARSRPSEGFAASCDAPARPDNERRSRPFLR